MHTKSIQHPKHSRLKTRVAKNLFSIIMIILSFWIMDCQPRKDQSQNSFQVAGEEFAQNWNVDDSLDKTGKTLALIQNSILVMKLFLVQNTPGKQKMPIVAPVIENIATKKLYFTSCLYEEVAILVNIPPGKYKIRGVQSRDRSLLDVMRLFPYASQSIVDFSPASIDFEIPSRTVHYSGDYSVYVNSEGQAQFAEPEFADKSRHLKQAYEAITSKFIGSHWSKLAHEWKQTRNN